MRVLGKWKSTLRQAPPPRSGEGRRTNPRSRGFTEFCVVCGGGGECFGSWPFPYRARRSVKLGVGMHANINGALWDKKTIRPSNS